MAAYLSQDWLDLHRAEGTQLPGRPGASARVQHVVTGTPDGEVRYSLAVVDGRFDHVALGDDPSAEVTLLQTYADAGQVAKGAVDVNVAFMQGRVKVTGDMGKVLALMPLTTSDEYHAALAAVSARTDY